MYFIVYYYSIFKDYYIITIFKLILNANKKKTNIKSLLQGNQNT